MDRSRARTGVFLANQRTASGALAASGVNRVGLYRFQIKSRSRLKLSLAGPGGLQMKPRNDRGALVAQSSAINREIAGGGYVPWYWGISPGAVRAMLEAAGFAVVEEHRLACHMTVVARMA